MRIRSVAGMTTNYAFGNTIDATQARFSSTSNVAVGAMLRMRLAYTICTAMYGNGWKIDTTITLMRRWTAALG